MNEILHADDAKLAQGALDQVVGGDGGAVASNLSRKNSSGVSAFFSELCYTSRVGCFSKTLFQNKIRAIPSRTPLGSI